MKGLSIKLFATAILLLAVTQACLAEEKKFCDSYDPQITRMEAIEGRGEVYPGFPKTLTAQEFQQLLPQTKETYCPACTLKDQTQCVERPCQEHNIMPGTIYQGIQVKSDPWMDMAGKEALKSVQNGGGPFGAVVIQVDDKTGKVIRYWANHNHVTEWNDPTAHAEITTIRAAAQELGTVNLGRINQKDTKLAQPGEWSHCVIYSSAEPCPMCLAAIYWSGINNLAFSATRFDADAKGINFSDNLIYQEISLPYSQRKHMYVVHSNSNNGLDAFNYYKRTNVARYGSD